MRLEGRRESDNVEDRRGMSSGAKAGVGGGLLGIIIALAVMFLGGGLGGNGGGGGLGDILGGGGGGGLGGIDIGDVLGNAMGGSSSTGAQSQSPTQFTEEEQALYKFSRQILAGTEDVWTKIFREQGLGEYVVPKMVIYTGYTSTACGQGQAAMGPFYCSGDRCVYLDLSFFETMERQLKAGGDFAYAYVIAHEVGHHVENLTGVLDQIHAKMRQYGQGSAKANRESVRIELLADYLAGCWAHYDNAEYSSMSDGDLEEAIRCAKNIGDDYLQKSAQGYAVPESFTHGTSEQRMKWFKAGYQTGDVKRGINAAMQLDYSQL